MGVGGDAWVTKKEFGAGKVGMWESSEEGET